VTALRQPTAAVSTALNDKPGSTVVFRHEPVSLSIFSILDPSQIKDLADGKNAKNQKVSQALRDVSLATATGAAA
jgi:hypothetical protein